MTAAAAASPTPTIPITTAAWAGPPSGDRCLARAPNAHAAPDMGIENRNDVPSDISSSPTLSTPSTTAAIARPLLSGRAVGAGVHARASTAGGGGSGLGGRHPAPAGRRWRLGTRRLPPGAGRRLGRIRGRRLEPRRRLPAGRARRQPAPHLLVVGHRRAIVAAPARRDGARSPARTRAGGRGTPPAPRGPPGRPAGTSGG